MKKKTYTGWNLFEDEIRTSQMSSYSLRDCASSQGKNWQHSFLVQINSFDETKNKTREIQQTEKVLIVFHFRGFQHDILRRLTAFHGFSIFKEFKRSVFVQSKRKHRLSKKYILIKIQPKLLPPTNSFARPMYFSLNRSIGL